MKRQALDHTKMDLLMRKLKIRRCLAVGIMESLWHLTARESPQGNIGKLSNERIAIGIDWGGDANRLVAALIEAGWIDSDDQHRLVIHDWQEHADEAVKKYIKRNHLEWAVSRQVQTSRDVSRLPVPEPVPVPEPAPAPEGTAPPSSVRAAVTELRKPTAADLDGQPSARFEEFWSRYPRRFKRDAAARAWISVVTQENEAHVFDCLGSYLASDEVSRGVVLDADKWIFQCHRDGWDSRWPARAAPVDTRPKSALERAKEAAVGR